MHQNMSTCIPTNPSPDRHGQDEKRIPYDAGMYVFEFAQCEMIDDIITIFPLWFVSRSLTNYSYFLLDFQESGIFNICFWNNGCEFEIRHYKKFASIY